MIRRQTQRQTQRQGAGTRAVMRIMVAAVILAAPLTIALPHASAAVIASVLPTFPTGVVVGQSNVAGNVTITNNSTNPENAGNVTVTSVTLIPSCGVLIATSDCPAGSRDPGVFQISTAVGSAGGACAGKTFTVTVIDSAQGKLQLTPNSTIILGPPGSATAVCQINVTFTVLKMPTLDANPGAGVQTAQMAAAVATHPDGSSSASFGASITTVRVQPTLVTAASAPVVVGSAVSDRATLSGGVNPTGVMTFDLYGAQDARCSQASLFKSTISVSGNGSYQSQLFVPPAPGSYHYVASYSGDANNAAVTGTCAAPHETAIVRHLAPGDYDRDGRTDIGVFRPNAVWRVRLSNGGTLSVTYGVAGDIPVPGDYDGDGKSDVGVYRPSTGTWYLRLSSVGDIVRVLGSPGDVPVPGDYDGDGRTDIAVYRPSTGVWYEHLSSGADTSFTYGIAGDVPVPADYDGDGKVNIAVYRPSGGFWYIHNSSGGDTFASYGAAGDIPVPGDYDGDGKADISVFRPSSGAWLIRRTTTGTDLVIFFGASGDIPVPGDYDGDGLTDIAAYRPSTGVWYIHRSAGGDTSTLYGAPRDIPLPLPAAIRLAYFP
jgi:hypothetical protein